jgi:hypothetical protein
MWCSEHANPSEFGKWGALRKNNDAVLDARAQSLFAGLCHPAGSLAGADNAQATDSRQVLRPAPDFETTVADTKRPAY